MDWSTTGYAHDFSPYGLWNKYFLVQFGAFLGFCDSTKWLQKFCSIGDSVHKCECILVILMYAWVLLSCFQH